MTFALAPAQVEPPTPAPIVTMPSSASARPNGTSSNVNQSQFGSSAASSHQAAAGSGTFHDHDDDELGDEDEEAIDASKSTEPLIVVAVVGRENAAAMALLADARGSQLVQTWAHEMVDDTMRAPWLLFIGSLEYELPEFIRLKARQSDLRIRWARLNLTAHSWRCLACRNVLWCTIDGRLTYARGCPKCEAKGEICYWRGEAIDSCEACVTGKAFCGAGGRGESQALPASALRVTDRLLPHLVNAKFTDDFVDYLDHHFGLGRDPSSSTWEASNFRYAQPFLDEFKHCRVLKSHLRAMKGSEAASRVPPELPKERATAPTKPTDEEIAKWVARTQHLSEEADYYDGQMATVARNSGRCSRALLPAGQLQDPIPAYPFTHIRGSLAYRYIQYPECVPKIVMADSRRASLLAIEHSHAGPQPFVKPPLPSRYDQRKPTAMAANTSLNSLGKRFVRDDDEEEDDDHDSIVSSSPASISPRLLPLRRPAKAKIESTRATIRATKTEEWWEKPGDGLNLLHAGKVQRIRYDDTAPMDDDEPLISTRMTTATSMSAARLRSLASSYQRLMNGESRTTPCGARRLIPSLRGRSAGLSSQT